jgi:uncharacterized protein (DUF1800 family)
MSRVSGTAGLMLAGLIATACASSPSSPPRSATPSPERRPEPGLRLPASALGPDQRILHVLNRLGYGPRPGDVDRVRRMGVGAYIERQLDPRGAPDPGLAQVLTAYPVLALGTAELVRDYPFPSPDVRRRIASGEMSRQEMLEAYPPTRRPAVVTASLQGARVTRAVVSERQLEEVMVDFWFNHFNVYAQKGAVRWMTPAYEREAIRPHALGRFRDLVLATARHPAGPTRAGGWASTRTTRASCWSCTPSAWTAGTPSRT